MLETTSAARAWPGTARSRPRTLRRWLRSARTGVTAAGLLRVAKARILSAVPPGTGRHCIPRISTTPVVGVAQRHRSARSRRDVEGERPLVVSRRSAVSANRRFLALAADAHHAAGDRRGRRVASASGRWWRDRVDAGLLTTDANHLELAALRHRVLVLLAQEPTLDERVDARREGIGDVRVLGSKEGDGAGVLLAAEDELGFFLPLRLVPPDRHRHRHQNRHDGERDEQGRHRVPALPLVISKTA